ncbi:hypothetical protein CEE36_01070 [candidate division TA06 bacterium B3_TA06]|uniref:DUF4440 domain-containing protein n=1 Tax=candidate division TA06 bacterium B3_TA06 TaxID=2012487 RepID=A0A532VAY2_UNCT6|nr:MAG: hypothetical protein CEE36_01070 [candidate division TA06 bacterium B3_TA06]
MKRAFCLIVAASLSLSILAGCKDRAADPLTVVNRYFAALDRGDIDEAYGYLCDRSLVIRTANGEEMPFLARPDLETYKTLAEKAPKISVTEIKRMPELSQENELEVFQITARTKERGRNVERASAQFLLYLAPNSEGRWSVLLPVSAKIKGTIADSSALEP